jgi:hypothetical protein
MVRGMIVTAGPEEPAQVTAPKSPGGGARDNGREDDVEPWRGRYPYPPWIAEEDVR